ncbi:helix-turn-helix transcriptional regulator [Cereibacter changlensis]|uniref:Helix-turn-helix transcriptional regulator n=1 Tax=Cereibacter changlensis TaxID=402884 RepID=A0A4U0YNF4_9RHOB|nr:helix-turn-helix transcriptional regulator [Cereibacter changlensis]TKA93912.1 helix-turn-helix transcriptional regulator [Cereibacter changlensis]
MAITSDQCRAGRGLLNWTQDQLSINAGVSRATITDFESNTRQPMKNNLRAIADCMFAAGIEFVPEEEGKGVGVRFRNRKLRYTNQVRIDRYNHWATMRMNYADEDFLCVVGLDAVDDYYRTNFRHDDEFTKALSDLLPTILRVSECFAPTHIREGKLVITYDMLKES